MWPVILFAGFALSIFYTIVGYPLLVAALAKRGKPIRKAPIEPTITILIAVYNGQDFLPDKLDSVVEVDYPRDKLECLVLSDGSTDGTNDVARRYSGQGIELVECPRGGKPAALNIGIARARGEILVLTDVRQVLERDALRQIVANFADPTVGAVSGDLPFRASRNAEEANTSHYWRFERWLRIQLGRVDSTFGTTGPFYAMRRSLAPVMPADVLLDDMYLPLHGFFQGYRVIVDEQARAIDYPLSVKGEFRRKMRTQAGVYQIMRFYPDLIHPVRNRMFWHWLSYKLMRLMLPHLFLGLLVSSLLLPGAWAWIFGGGQLFFYVLAGLDFVTPTGFPGKKLMTTARTFVAMLAAAAGALSVFFVAPQRLWKVTQAQPRQTGGNTEKGH